MGEIPGPFEARACSGQSPPFAPRRRRRGTFPSRQPRAPGGASTLRPGIGSVQTPPPPSSTWGRHSPRNPKESEKGNSPSGVGARAPPARRSPSFHNSAESPPPAHPPLKRGPGVLSAASRQSLRELQVLFDPQVDMALAREPGPQYAFDM